MLEEVPYLHIREGNILQSAGSFIIDSNSLSVAAPHNWLPQLLGPNFQRTKLQLLQAQNESTTSHLKINHR